ncbi:FUSC family protein [Mycetocola sp. JXN-3]|uniref:FUSC family protein n=1 Tax=Mycetocola sp. JXN-3 TaxID=2116510 RepID=UPI00165D1919|nr:FUSC family protein [Mycetocola sp. JXN-3]
MRLTSLIRTSSRIPLLQALKTSIATVLAWFAASAVLPSQMPVFAAVGALLVVQPSLHQSAGKAIERSIGVIGGVLIATGVNLVFGLQSWAILLAIVISIMLAWVFRLSPGSSNQIPISAMLVLAIGGATPDYAWHRILETLIGVAIGFVVNAAIVPPVILAPAQREAAQLAQSVAAQLDDLAAALPAQQSRAELDSLMISARLLRPMRDKALAAIRVGEESLTMNPRRSNHRDRLNETKALIHTLSALTNRVVGMSRAFHDHYDDGLRDEPTVRAIAQELSRAAHDLRLLADARILDGRDPELSVPIEEPMLTAPITIHKPNPLHWILIGSLMEDLRRIREEITGDA